MHSKNIFLIYLNASLLIKVRWSFDKTKCISNYLVQAGSILITNVNQQSLSINKVIFVYSPFMSLRDLNISRVINVSRGHLSTGTIHYLLYQT